MSTSSLNLVAIEEARSLETNSTKVAPTSDDLMNSVSIESYNSVARMLFNFRSAAGCQQPHLFDEDIPLPRICSRCMDPLDESPEIRKARGELEVAKVRLEIAEINARTHAIYNGMRREDEDLQHQREIERQKQLSLVNSVSLENYHSVARMLFSFRSAAGCKKPHLFDEDVDFSKMSPILSSSPNLHLQPEMNSLEGMRDSGPRSLEVLRDEGQLGGTPSSGFSSGSSLASQ